MNTFYVNIRCCIVNRSAEDLFPGLFAGIGGRETETHRIKEKLETKDPR